jgi:hypothetical protein
MGSWLAWSYHVDPDQAIGRSRGAWASAGHGMLGFLFGCGVGGFGLWLGAWSGRRLISNTTALAITHDGLEAHLKLGRSLVLPWRDLERAEVEWIELRSRGPFIPEARVAMLIISPSASGGATAQPVKLSMQDIQGGLASLSAFADAFNQAMSLNRARKP